MSASITSLTYGNVSVLHKAEVVQRIQAAIETFTPFQVTNVSMGGDTLEFKVKEMIVEYTFQGRKAVRKATENQSVNFGVWITDMKYGMEDKFLGLSDYYDGKPRFLQSVYNVIDSKTKLAITNENMLVSVASDDPTPGKVKKLVVDFVSALKPGRGYPQSGTEGQDFKRGTITIQEGRTLSSSDFSASSTGGSSGPPVGGSANLGSGSIEVLIDDKPLRQFREKNMQLCFAFGVNDSFNVIAYATQPADRVKVSWENSYMIAASQYGFDDGVKFDVATTPREIAFGQTYPLAADWHSEVPKFGEERLSDGFIFEIGRRAEGSAVLYKKIEGNHVPIYFSSRGPLPQGVEWLTPKHMIKVWVAPYGESGVMVSRFRGETMTVDVSKAKTTITYDRDGKWQLS